MVWHHSLLLLNSFNKTKAAIFSCRLCFLRAFPFISLLSFVFTCPSSLHRYIPTSFSRQLVSNVLIEQYWFSHIIFKFCRSVSWRVVGQLFSMFFSSIVFHFKISSSLQVIGETWLLLDCYSKSVVAFMFRWQAIKFRLHSKCTIMNVNSLIRYIQF